jgi:hypothetical protein
MPKLRHSLVLVLAWTACCVAIWAAEPPPAVPLALHPDNPHYFLFRGRPTVLITSGEHYGAVLNLDFDYARYLDELQTHGLNQTRLFSGAYVEPQGAFKIAENTLAPAAERYLAPWARSGTPGYANGGNKFDLAQWDDAYFARLRDFVAQASRRGVIVEMNLFCPFYDEAQWRLSPQNAANNVNALGLVQRTDVYTLDKDGGLLAVHVRLTRKIAAALQEFDNVYYEVCNEPYFGGVTIEWQHLIVDTLVDAEKNLPHKHLISMNIANGAKQVERPHPTVSIFNFHYANPPDAVTQNFGLRKAIGDNETGFKGTGDTHYRREGWEFMLAGGALYSNLDYSFAVGHEDGTFAYPSTQPGGGNRAFRQQLQVLKQFLDGFDFVKMRPDQSVFAGGLSGKVQARALVEPGRQYAVYLFGSGQSVLRLNLPGGQYAAQWLNPLDGKITREERLQHPGGQLALTPPRYQEDIALRITK